MANQGGNLKSTSVNGVKVYTVASQQRSLATWLSAKKLRALRKDENDTSRVDLIQDLSFETATSKIKAWHLCDPEAEKVFKALRKAKVKVAMVSNFDTRLRPLLKALHCDHWFDAIAVSAEVEAEKPNPTIFLKACELLGVKTEEVVHIGDDQRNDVWGARDAGCDAWLWGSDVHSFKEVAERIGVKL